MNNSNTSYDSGKSKHKKKVSFSIFEVSTFDELAKLRKLREEELDDFVSNKKKTNQYLTNLNQRNKILSMSNKDLISFENNNVSRNNNVIKNINFINMNIPRPVKKDESSGNESYLITNQDNFTDALKNKINLNKNKKRVIFSSDEEEDIKSNDLFSNPPQLNSAENNEITNNDIMNCLNNIQSPSNNKNLITKDNTFSPNSNENNTNNTNMNNAAQKYNNIIFSEKNEILENIEDNIPNDINEQNEDDNKESKKEFITFKKENHNNHENNIDSRKKEENNKKINEDENEDRLDENREKNNSTEEKDEQKEYEEKESQKKETNITILFNLLEDIYRISPKHKIELINDFFIKLFNYIEYKYDLYINYEENDLNYYEEVQNKIRLINTKIHFNTFIDNIKENIRKKELYNEHKIKAEKYAQYINYKYKINAFNNLLTFSVKQKAWIKSIQVGLMKRMVWSCLDSMKLYANYRKIKNYLKIRKKKVIFDALKNNKQLSLQLLKNGRKLSLIFEYRHFFNNCRKKILAGKGKEINNKLVSEFRNQYLLKGIFNLIKKNHDIRKEKRDNYNNLILKRNQKAKDYINIKITRRETIKYNTDSTLMRIQSKINVV